jgi:hypothetical protein
MRSNTVKLDNLFSSLCDLRSLGQEKGEMSTNYVGNLTQMQTKESKFSTNHLKLFPKMGSSCAISCTICHYCSHYRLGLAYQKTIITSLFPSFEVNTANAELHYKLTLKSFVLRVSSRDSVHFKLKMKGLHAD